MDKIIPLPGEFQVLENLQYPQALAGYVSPVAFTLEHLNDEAHVDTAINDDLINTRGRDDELAVFNEPEIQLMSANQSWVNVHHGAYNISNRTQKVQYIVVHYTGSGTSAPGAARNNCIYFSGGNRNASADFFIDDSGIWEYADSDRYYTWHCGDGGGKYGITNSNSVGIEVCMNGNNPYTGAEIGYLTRLVQFLMMKYGVPAERVVRHYDASRKQCPYYYVDQTRWNQLHAIITNGDDDMITNEQIELIGQSVWDRGVQLSNGKWVESGKVLAGTYEEIMRTDDPSGRDVLMKDHDHIKWMAKVQAQQTEKLDAILQVLERIANKLG